jgi:hypothetical protein
MDVGHAAKSSEGGAERIFSGFEGQISHEQLGIHIDDARIYRPLPARSRKSGFESSTELKLT